MSTGTSEGLDLKDSAVVSFFVSLVLVTILAIVSGDGLLGEVQFVVVGFLLFFIVFWLMIAWVFWGLKEDLLIDMEKFYKDTKECPMCAETVKAKAKICRFCKHKFK